MAITKSTKKSKTSSKKKVPSKKSNKSSLNYGSNFSLQPGAIGGFILSSNSSTSNSNNSFPTTNS